LLGALKPLAPSSPPPEVTSAVEAIPSHIKKFWDPHRRRKIVAHLDRGAEGLDPPVKLAIETLQAVLN
jgi:hypothetical protein